MADFTHDAASMTDDGFHEIQLSGKQLVFLFMMAAVVLVATFLCGVQVGRGVRSATIDAATAEALSTATPPPTASTPPQTAAASSGPPAAEPPAPAQEQDDELSYAKRLQGDNAPAEKLKAPGAKPAPAAEPKSAEPKPAEPKAAEPKVTEPKVTEPKVTEPKAAAAKTPTPKPATPAAPKPDAAAATGQPGAWVVQLVALKDRNEATAMARRLTSKGYPAFVLDPAAGAPVIYRVQVGGYTDREHADQAARQIQKEEKMQGYVRSR